ncbi:MAG: metalloregulator ArsR/SmtB family transcription factor [Pseudomonadota bacterium]
MDLSKTVDALRAAGEPTRLRILALLREGELAVGELAQVLGQSQPRLSHHMKALASAGLVERLPEGSWVFYRLTGTGPCRDLVNAVLATVEADGLEFTRDRGQLEMVRRNRAAAAEAYFGGVAETWDAIRSLHYPNEAIEAALLDAAGPGPFGQVIDIGTGTGRMLALFAARARRAEGLDFSHQMLTVARANLARDGVSNARVRHGDAAATPFEAGCADLVLIHQVLHYVEAPDQVIAEAARILAPGGRILIVDFAPHDLEFLRQRHGHRRLGVRHEAMVEWLADVGLPASPPLQFAPPHDKDQGLAVQIWTVERPQLAQETAA